MRAGRSARVTNRTVHYFRSTFQKTLLPSHRRRIVTEPIFIRIRKLAVASVRLSALRETRGIL